MTRYFQVAIVLLLVTGLVGGSAIAAMAAPDQATVRNQNRDMAEKQIRHQNRTAVQQDQYLTSSGPVVGLNADRDQDRLKDGTGDGDPDRDRVRLQDRIMDCVDQFCDWLRGAGSR